MYYVSPAKNTNNKRLTPKQVSLTDFCFKPQWNSTFWGVRKRSNEGKVEGGLDHTDMGIRSKTGNHRTEKAWVLKLACILF